MIDSISVVASGAEIPDSKRGSPLQVKTFGGVLDSALENSGQIRFSNHARKRLEERRISFSERDVIRIAKSADDAMAKGSKEALLVMDRLALVLGVANRTVITVMEPQERVNTVFTNIDSVVMVAKD